MAKTRVQIAKAGDYLGHWQGPYTLLVADLERMAANHAREVVIDYEHASELGIVPAPAAGWVKSLAVEGDLLLGEVEWTATALGMIDADEYRYLSPVIDFYAHDRETGNPIGAYLRSVGLTNTPFMTLEGVTAAPPVLHGLKGELLSQRPITRTALLNRQQPDPQPNPVSTMDERLKAFLNRFGVALGTPSAATDELAALDEARQIKINADRVPTLEARIAELEKQLGDATATVTTQAAQLEATEKAADEALLNSAVADFRIPAAERDAYAAKLNADRAGTRAVLNALPKDAHKPGRATAVAEPTGVRQNGDRPKKASDRMREEMKAKMDADKA